MQPLLYGHVNETNHVLRGVPLYGMNRWHHMGRCVCKNVQYRGQCTQMRNIGRYRWRHSIQRPGGMPSLYGYAFSSYGMKTRFLQK